MGSSGMRRTWEWVLKDTQEEAGHRGCCWHGEVGWDLGVAQQLGQSGRLGQLSRTLGVMGRSPRWRLRPPERGRALVGLLPALPRPLL